MEHREVELREDADLGAADPAAARFLRELRQLRVLADLGHAELAARAHYPRAVIEAAESGPSLPELPVLSAYVRGCGGTAEEVADWEDRWRSVTGAKASPLLPARDAGNSDAASAGARIGATSAAADSHDPAAIMAALDRFAETMATTSGPPSPSAVNGGTVNVGTVNGGTVKAASARLTDSVPGMRAPAAPPPPWGPRAPAGPPTMTTGAGGPEDHTTRDFAPGILTQGESLTGTRERSPSGPPGAALSPDPARHPGAERRLRDRAGLPHRAGLPGRVRLAVAAGVILCLFLVLVVLFA